MRYEVDIEAYGTISLEMATTESAIMCVRIDEQDSRFELNQDEFRQLTRAIHFVQGDMGVS